MVVQEHQVLQEQMVLQERQVHQGQMVVQEQVGQAVHQVLM